jgi:hypothetical protein
MVDATIGNRPGQVKLKLSLHGFPEIFAEKIIVKWLISSNSA